jgi:hypothetical protein
MGNLSSSDRKTGIRATYKIKKLTNRVAALKNRECRPTKLGVGKHFCPVDIPQVFRNTPVDTPQEDACSVTSQKFFRALSI